jgi:preprotein translocase subunit SecB
MADQDMLTPETVPATRPLGPQAATLAQYSRTVDRKSQFAPGLSVDRISLASTSSSTSTSIAVSDEVHEVVIKLDVSARSDSGVQFMVELSLCRAVRPAQFSRRGARPFLLVEAPRLLFPFARQIIADVHAELGLPAAASGRDRLRRSLSRQLAGTAATER